MVAKEINSPTTLSFLFRNIYNYGKAMSCSETKNSASEIASELYSFKAADCRFEMVFPACIAGFLTQYLAGHILYV